ncbi:hypothetical protein [Kitasatospora aureofaciens]
MGDGLRPGRGQRGAHAVEMVSDGDNTVERVPHVKGLAVPIAEQIQDVAP